MKFLGPTSFVLLSKYSVLHFFFTYTIVSVTVHTLPSRFSCLPFFQPHLFALFIHTFHRRLGLDSFTAYYSCSSSFRTISSLRQRQGILFHSIHLFFLLKLRLATFLLQCGQLLPQHFASFLTACIRLSLRRAVCS